MTELQKLIESARAAAHATEVANMVPGETVAQRGAQRQQLELARQQRAWADFAEKNQNG